MNKLHTTHSWDFLGLDPAYKSDSAAMDSSSNAIVGVWPESESFTDYGLGPVPEKFKGDARFCSKGFEAKIGPLEDVVNKIFFRLARDSDGHGTHITSTIAGSIVANASLFDMAKGTARGGAPSARLAIYKACWFGFCSDAEWRTLKKGRRNKKGERRNEGQIGDSEKTKHQNAVV
ncbi:Peptidase S8, subtilisin, His-active site [Sesbania bispinosa]|nr:Peptidase S8, subtilisin, His-active site [Sesbania bispinosa]